MKPPPFSYHDPRTPADVVGLLGSLDNAKLLAGGQSLMPMLNMRYVLPDHIIDLNRVDGLNYIRENNGAIEIGAMTRQRDIEFSDVVQKRCPLMHEAIRQVGHRQTRNRGTLGGSLCHLDPSAELVSCAAALDAKVSVAGRNGVAQHRFFGFSCRLHDAGALNSTSFSPARVFRAGRPVTAMRSSNFRAAMAISPSFRRPSSLKRTRMAR